MPQSAGTDLSYTSERQARREANPFPSAEAAAVLRNRFLTELAYYEADKAYLTAEKCAARCRWLSELLTAAINAGGDPDA